MTLSITSAFSMSTTERWPRSFIRFVWNPLKALSTRWTWNASAFASSVQASAGFGEERELGEEEGLGEAEADGVAMWLADGDADAFAAALGLGDASVIVIVVTPFWVDTLTSAPVAPSRNRPEIAPDFACSSRDRNLPNISPPFAGYTD